jgi:quercetin dioxygenase-like cupin family protein
MEPAEATALARKADSAELSEAWIAIDPSARWRSGSGHGPDQGAGASGSSFLEVEPGCRLPRHTDSAEETIVVTAGRAAVTVGGHDEEVSRGDVVLVPADEPHEVRNAGDEPLRFVAVYAGTDVVTTYEDEVQPDGSRQRQPVG